MEPPNEGKQEPRTDGAQRLPREPDNGLALRGGQPPVGPGESTPSPEELRAALITEAQGALSDIVETLALPEGSAAHLEVATDADLERVSHDARERSRWRRALGDGYRAALNLAYGGHVPPRNERIL